MLEIVGPHQPDEFHAGKQAVQAGERRPGMAGADPGLNRGRQDTPPIGNGLGAGQPFGEGRHAPRRLERIARRDHEPDLIQRETPACQARDMPMAVMGRVEGPAQDTDAHAPPVAMTRQRVGGEAHDVWRQLRT